MGLNESKGNMYPWITHTWNTVKGACPHDCSYCYMKRFGQQKSVHFDKKELKTDFGAGNFIFVGSSCDMFANTIPIEWILETLRKCIGSPGNKYLFQTKNPGAFMSIQKVGYWRPNICTTIETNRWYPEIMHNSPRPEERAECMGMFSAYPRYVTIEPIIDFDLPKMVELIKRCNPAQVNIGADSGRNSLPEPHFDKVLELMDQLKGFTTIAEKKNLDRLRRK
jgi:DNA repair photolyase